MKPIVPVLMLLVLLSSRALAADFKNVNAQEFEKMRVAKTNIVLDVRTQKEYDAGHIHGAKLIDFNSPDFDKTVSALDKDKTYLVHCAGGGRSAKASAQIGAMRFQNVYNPQGGYPAWDKAGNKPE